MTTKRHKTNVIIIIFIIHKDAFLYKGASNRDGESRLATSFLRNGLKSFRSKLFKYLFTISPGHIYGNYFCWGFALAYCMHLNAGLFSCADGTRYYSGTLNTIESVSRSRVVSTNFFSALFDGCLKYINIKEPKRDPHGFKCRALAFNSVEIMFATYCCGCIIEMAKSRLVFSDAFSRKKKQSLIFGSIWYTTHRY